MTDSDTTKWSYKDEEAAKSVAGLWASETDGRERFYGRAQARNLLRKFHQATGREAETVSELADWVSHQIH